MMNESMTPEQKSDTLREINILLTDALEMATAPAPLQDDDFNHIEMVLTHLTEHISKLENSSIDSLLPF